LGVSKSEYFALLVPPPQPRAVSNRTVIIVNRSIIVGSRR
jgi:hypothetical protein